MARKRSPLPFPFNHNTPCTNHTSSSARTGGEGNLTSSGSSTSGGGGSPSRGGTCLLGASAMSGGGDMEAAIRRLVPPLSYGARKGQMGRVGVLGGSADFTGAPFYAGMASLKVIESIYIGGLSGCMQKGRSLSHTLSLSHAPNRWAATCPTS